MNTKTNILVAFVAAFFSVEAHKATAQSAVQEYMVVDFIPFWSISSDAFGINNKGGVVGKIDMGNGEQAFLYAEGSLMELGESGATAYAINGMSQFVGRYGATQGAFFFSNGRFEDLSPLRAVNAYDINDGGEVVGELGSHDGFSRAFLYSGGVMQDLGTFPSGIPRSTAYGINKNGSVVGWAITGDGQTHAFVRLSGGEMQDLGTLEGGSFSIAHSINDSSQIVGQAGVDLSTRVRAFSYANGSMQSLGTLGSGDYSIAYAINNSGQVVGTSTTTEMGEEHAFLYSGGVMHDLNDLVVNRGTWVLIHARAINDLGQIVGKGIHQGLESAFLLSPVPLGWRETMETQCVLPTYGECPTKEAGKENLIVVTHGWIPAWKTPEESTSWVDQMTNLISQYFLSKGINSWQIEGYKWIEKAHPLDFISRVLPTHAAKKALESGKEEGLSLGRNLASSGWKHIHFIAHSAGSALIQSATDVIKNTPGNTTTIHETFLDPFVGFDKVGVSNYGKGADWADNYFTRDLLTGIWELTESALEYCYDIDVTFLDPDKKRINGFMSDSGGLNEPCLVTKTEHGWPVDFYINTIKGVVISEYKGFGFRLSREGGDWEDALEQYPITNRVLRVLGPQDPECIERLESSTPQIIGPQADFTKVSVRNDLARVALLGPDSAELNTGSPAWLAAFVSLTNPVNFVSFDARFTSVSGAQGLLTVYWDTNVIGSTDERVSLSGFRRYTLAFPKAGENSTHMLGFRLDAFTNIQSRVIITNVALGFVGVSEPFSLSFTTNTFEGFRILQLAGQPGFTYVVEASTNLLNWEAIALLINTNGTVRFVDHTSSNAPARFYRAVAP